MSQLLLALTNAAAVQAERRVASTAAVPFTTGDCRRRHEKPTRRGAVIVSEPQPMGYGGSDAVIQDGCGNLLNLHQG
jgi:predicted enzyme related to lactoylglutathione lyase